MSADTGRYAKVEDEDSDTGEALEGTAVEARLPSASKAQVAGPASDSGYSSYANSSYSTLSHGSDSRDAVIASGVVATRDHAGAYPAPRSGRDGGKPVVVHNGSNTRRDAQDPPPRQGEWRFTLPHERPPVATSFQPGTIPNPPMQQSHSQQQPHLYNPSMPPPPVPRLRRPSLEHHHPRPHSYHDAMNYTAIPHGAASYDNSQRGPPLSYSAQYATRGYPNYAMPPSSGEYFAPPAGNAPAMTRPAQSPTSPTSPVKVMSARHRGPSGEAQSLPPQHQPQHQHQSRPPLPLPLPVSRPPTFSARRRSVNYETLNQHEFEYAPDDEHGDEPAYAHHASSSKRSSFQAIPRSISPTRANESRYRAPYSDAAYDREYLDRPDSSDPRLEALNSKQLLPSLRPSLLTRTSSNRTRDSRTSGTGDVMIKVLVEDQHGRRHTYMSKAEIRQRLEDQERDRVDDLHPHMDNLKVEESMAKLDRRVKRSMEHQQASAPAVELTAEALRNVPHNTSSRSGSHMSASRSQKSGKTSGTKRSNTTSQVITIQNGDTTLHVTGEARIEMRQTEEGGPTQLVVTSASGRDSGYITSSKSSKSRSRMGSDTSRRRGLREDDGHDSAGYEIER